jgi:hypothetical protein
MRAYSTCVALRSPKRVGLRELHDRLVVRGSCVLRGLIVEGLVKQDQGSLRRRVVHLM